MFAWLIRGFYLSILRAHTWHIHDVDIIALLVSRITRSTWGTHARARAMCGTGSLVLTVWKYSTRRHFDGIQCTDMIQHRTTVTTVLSEMHKCSNVDGLRCIANARTYGNGHIIYVCTNRNERKKTAIFRQYITHIALKFPFSGYTHTYRSARLMADTDHMLKWNYPRVLDRPARRSAMGTSPGRRCCGILFVNGRCSPITSARICKRKQTNQIYCCARKDSQSLA